MRRLDQAPPQRHRGNGKPKIDGEWFTRASTFASVLDDKENLIGWKAKLAARGVAHDPGLLSLAATTPLDDRDRWREIVDRASSQAGANTGADLGTSIHKATEMYEYGEPDFGRLEKWLQADAIAAVDAIKAARLTSLAAEVFVANRQMKTAGTFDRLVSDGTHAYILDLKTIGADKDVDYALRYSSLSWSVQIALYATSKPWDGLLGYRSWEEEQLVQPSTTRGLVAVVRRGTATCELVEVDLAFGLRAARIAEQVRHVRSAAPKSASRIAQEVLI